MLYFFSIEQGNTSSEGVAGKQIKILKQQIIISKERISSLENGLKDFRYIATGLNLSTRADKLDLEDLQNLKTPCILYWNMNHSVVLKKVERNEVIIHDSTIGVVRLNMKKVSKHSTYVAMELLPTTQFTKKKGKTRLHLSDL